MSQSLGVVSCGLVFLVATLSGCGDSGGSKTTSPGPSPTPPPASTSTTTSTTTTPLPPRSAPKPCADTVAELNSNYGGYDETDPSSPSGVTVSWFSRNLTSFIGQLFCATRLDTHCFQGRADCAMSAAIINHKIYVDDEISAPVSYAGYPIGVILDQEKVETKLSKCVYSWDGSSNNRRNRKCGSGAPGAGADGCDNPECAFNNVCGDDHHTCRADDWEIQGTRCKCDQDWCSESPDKYGPRELPEDRGSAQCFFEMPSLIADAPTNTNHLKDALRWRLIKQDEAGWAKDTVNQDTEIVIDEEVLIDEAWTDPAKVIRGISYVPGQKAAAEIMRDNLHEYYRMGDLPKIPVIKMETHQNWKVTNGPFHCEDSGDEQLLV